MSAGKAVPAYGRGPQLRQRQAKAWDASPLRQSNARDASPLRRSKVASPADELVPRRQSHQPSHVKVFRHRRSNVEEAEDKKVCELPHHVRPELAELGE